MTIKYPIIILKQYSYKILISKLVKVIKISYNMFIKKKIFI